MRLRAATVAGLLALAGCGGEATPATTTTTPSTVAVVTTSTPTTIGMAVVPGVVGRDLAAARAALAAVGFKLTANDGTQKKRAPADDWIVYSQSPPPGAQVLTSVYVFLELLQKGERYQTPGSSPCPRLVQC